MKDIYLLRFRYPILESCQKDIEHAVTAIIRCYEKGGKVLVCGNGGSFADAEHIVGELMKGFCRKRPLSSELKKALIGAVKEPDGMGKQVESDGPDEMSELAKALGQKLQTPLRSLTLGGMPALSSAFANDVEPDFSYAQQAFGLTDAGDVLIGISTSGNAKNVLAAALAAKARGAVLIALTGKDGGKMNNIFDILIKVPETETYRVQELHLPVYHAVCLAVESHFFSE